MQASSYPPQRKAPLLIEGGRLPKAIRGEKIFQAPPVSRWLTAPNYQPNRNPMKWFRFGKEEGGCEYGVFAAPAETECSSLLLTQRGPLGGAEPRLYKIHRNRYRVQKNTAREGGVLNHP